MAESHTLIIPKSMKTYATIDEMVKYPVDYLKWLGYDLDQYCFICIPAREKDYPHIMSHYFDSLDWRREACDENLFLLGKNKAGSHDLQEKFEESNVTITYSQHLYIIAPKNFGVSGIKRYCQWICSKPALATANGSLTFDLNKHGYRRMFARKLEHIYMQCAQTDKKREIVADIENFLSDATLELYRHHERPHRLVYLLHGLYGTGKKSLVRAIAQHLQMLLVLISLDAIVDGAVSFAMIPDNCIVMVTGMPDKITPNLIHLLDNLRGYHKLVVFLVAEKTGFMNDPKMGPGKINRVVKFGPITKEAATEMLQNFYTVQNEPDPLILADRDQLILSDRDQLISHIADTVSDKIVSSEFEALIFDHATLKTLSEKMDRKIAEIKKRYSETHQVNQDMSKKHYGEHYKAFQTQAGMYQ